MAANEGDMGLVFKQYLSAEDIEQGVERILAHQKTAYQEMYIVKTRDYGKALILDGRWQSSMADEFLYHEPLVHAGMVCHGSPQNILILGGGEGATIREVLRWKTVEKVVMVDIDREVVEACRQYLPEMHQNAFDDHRVDVHIGDALQFIEKSDREWDVIISDLSEPVERGPSFPLFTQEIFAKVGQILREKGVFVLQAGSRSSMELSIHSRLARTLQQVFPHVHSYSSYIPSFATEWGFLLTSGQAIDSRPDPDTVDKLLAEKTTGGFKMFDGITLLGMLQIPAHIRRAIAAETEVYTLAKPPKLFGTG